LSRFRSGSSGGRGRHLIPAARGGCQPSAGSEHSGRPEPPMLGFGVFMQYAICLICADEIATGELRQHLTGDYHTGCFTTIAAAGITVDRWTGEEAKCALCQQDIARQAVVVKPAHLVVHLRCFFTPPRAARKSLGAAASIESAAQNG